MSKIKWDQIGERLYETGTDRGVLYPFKNGAYAAGVAWNGLTGVTQSPEGAESTALYADNTKYLNLMSAEDFKATINAYMYPDEFAACNGEVEIAPGVVVTQQTRSTFGLSYRTLIGNDTEGTNHGYKLHLVYGALAAPSEKSYSTVNDSPEAMELSWEISTTPVELPGFKPTAHVEIDSTKVDATKLAALEDILYGTEDAEARLPELTELVTIFNTADPGPDPDPDPQG